MKAVYDWLRDKYIGLNWFLSKAFYPYAFKDKNGKWIDQ